MGNHSLLQGNFPYPGISSLTWVSSERPGKPLYAEAFPLSLLLSFSLLCKVRREENMVFCPTAVPSSLGGEVGAFCMVTWAAHFDLGAILRLSPWAKVSPKPLSLVSSLDSACFWSGDGGEAERPGYLGFSSRNIENNSVVTFSQSSIQKCLFGYEIKAIRWHNNSYIYLIVTH